jgi:hypothetical protein
MIMPAATGGTMTNSRMPIRVRPPTLVKVAVRGVRAAAKPSVWPGRSRRTSRRPHLTRTTIDADTRRPVAGPEYLPGVHALAVEDNRVRFAVDGEHLDAAVQASSRFGLQSLTGQPPTLEELMLRHYGDDLRPSQVGASS